MRRLLPLLALGLLSGCVSTAVGLAGDVAEGAVKTTVFATKTTAKGVGAVAGAVTPGGGEKDEDER